MLSRIDFILYLATVHRDAIISFLRDIVAIPSYDNNVRNVAVRCEHK